MGSVKQLLETHQVHRVETKRLLRRLGEIEQYQRANNVEIKGIPLETDPVEVVKGLGDIVGEPVQQTEMDICH